jgi:hypothetical protein
MTDPDAPAPLPAPEARTCRNQAPPGTVGLCIAWDDRTLLAEVRSSQPRRVEVPERERLFLVLQALWGLGDGSGHELPGRRRGLVTLEIGTVRPLASLEVASAILSAHGYRVDVKEVNLLARPLRHDDPACPGSFRWAGWQAAEVVGGEDIPGAPARVDDLPPRVVRLPVRRCPACLQPTDARHLTGVA